MEKKIKYRPLLGILIILALMFPVLSFAAVHDPVEEASSDTATIYLGKVLTVSQQGRFPEVHEFTFEIEPVRAWDNANVLSAENGAEIAAAEMPLPQACADAHHTVTTDGTVTEVTVGDFMGDPTTDVADTQTEKLRTTPVSIRFLKAGYYVYRVTETGSAPAELPGVTYDDSSYYIAFYVCNKTDSEGNTVSGVYVHDITSYRNGPDDDAGPNLSDIAGTTDNGGTAAAENTYENFEKVGRSSDTPGEDPETGLPTGPDKLEAYRFWNDLTTHDVVITNNVTGNLGDVTKEFEMTVTLSGLEKGRTYTTNAAAEEKTAQASTSEGADLVSASAGTVNSDAKTFTADQAGNAVFLIRLKDDEVFVMNALPASAEYRVEEHATDHIASYAITSTREETAVIAKDEDANTADHTALATDVETVDAKSNVAGRVNADENDGTVTIAFTNHRNLATITGLPYYGDAVSAGAAILVAAFLLLLLRRRRSLS
ncbi:MAG: hypothetical protein IJH75_01545 [Mogibacterium sp.]|nr:hypothetical protein [Mogibacterium sp.]